MPHCVTGQVLPSPHPVPLPQGEGTAVQQLCIFQTRVLETPRCEFHGNRAGFTLSPRERAGVRG